MATGITAAGTAWTSQQATIAGLGVARWALRDGRAGDANIPAVLYFHGAGGGPNQFETTPAWSGLRDWVIDNGWCWIEGTGGTTSNGAQNWGNDSARAAYPAYLAHVEGVLDIGVVALLGRSMGALVATWLYSQSSIASRFAGLLNVSGVSTLFVGDTSGGGASIDQSTGRYFTNSVIWGAYGATTYDEFVTAAADHAPEGWPAPSWDGKHILSVYGTADTTVPWYPRGAGALRTLWAGHPAEDLTVEKVGGDHTTGSSGTYYEVAAMSAFLASLVGDTPPPEPTDVYAIRKRALLRDDGKLYEIVNSAMAT